MKEQVAPKPPLITLLASEEFLKENSEGGYIVMVIPVVNMDVQDVPTGHSRT